MEPGTFTVRYASKILWGEGLFLRPQHFQRQDAYHEYRLHQLLSTLYPYAWGVQRLRFDTQSLANSTVRLVEAVAVFPDGEPYAAPEADELPPPLSLQDWPVGADSAEIRLLLPGLRDHGGNCAVDADPGGRRFLSASHRSADWYSQAAEAEITFLRKNARLVLSNEPLQADAMLPIARIRRTAEGGFELDESFIPPCTSIRTAPALTLALRRLLDALSAKIDALSGLHRESSHHVVEFRSGDIGSYWLLHTASAGFAALSHFHHHLDLHPERLHQELLRLAGALLTFSRSRSLNDLPSYRHDRPGQAFGAVFELIRELLETVISARHFSIALSIVKPSYYLGRLDSGKLDERSALYLSVSADLPAQELAAMVPVRFKVGAPDDVENFVLSALPGLKLVHTPQVPAAIPARPGNQYFLIEARGPLYARMLAAQALMIFAPAGMPELKLELLVITP